MHRIDCPADPYRRDALHPQNHKQYPKIDLNLLGEAGEQGFVEIPNATTQAAMQEARAVSESKHSNPKDAIGSDKLPLHLWPTTATAMGCLGLLEGSCKYGRSNWREAGVRASIYVDAAKRHLDAWFEGEDTAPDSGLPHLANALACIAIIVDAQAYDKLNDDRAYTPSSGYRKLIEKLTPHVARVKALHAEKNPKHFTIKDNI